MASSTSQPDAEATAPSPIDNICSFYDADGNGVIQREELFAVLAACARDIGLEVDSYLEQIVDTIFSNAQLDPSGSMTYDSLRQVLKDRPNLVAELSLAKGFRETNYAGAHNNTTNTSTNTSASTSCSSGATHDGLGKLLIDGWDAKIKCLSKHVPLLNKLRWEYISNNLIRFAFFLVIFTTSLGLFVGRISSYWGSCGFLILARASGQCLNFFCSIIVLLVCRRSISTLRSHGFGRYLPLDDSVYFHKMIGLFIVGHSISHAFGHLVNFALEAAKPDAKFTFVEFLFSSHTNIGWIGGCASITGWVLLVIIMIMVLAQFFSRSLGKFELFYYTHLLYIPFWLLLFVHASHFWIWFIGPCFVFGVETAIRLRNLLTNFTSNGQTTIVRAVALPSNVIHLVIKRPPNFDYNPGDWVYVLIPQIAKYEWHPFTISSAPEQEGVIWLHIRAVGEWTRSLKSYFEGVDHRNQLTKFIRSGQFSISIDQFDHPLPGLSTGTSILNGPHSAAGPAGTTRAQLFRGSKAAEQTISLATIPEDSSLKCNTPSLSANAQFDLAAPTQPTAKSIGPAKPMPNLTVFLDGPYGSPSSQIFGAEHAVLIATGIGVTPFASILQSIVHHYEKRRQRCPKCTYEFSDTRPPIVCKLRKVDFVWINRDQKSFEWFIKLLAELELTQSNLTPSERFLDIHIHLTAMEPAQIKSMGLQLALYLVHERNQKDLVTGLKTRTKAGRPNWDKFFANIYEQQRGKVSVFFCGQPKLGRILHRQCDAFGFRFRKEIF